MFDKKDFQRFAVSAIGAVTLSAASVFAAAAPARAGVPAAQTVADWQSSVERQIDRRMHVSSDVLPTYGAPNAAIVAVRFTADGDYAGATLARSSGERVYDRHALSVARHIAYPALPAGLRGKAQTVEMQLSYENGSAHGRNDRPAQLARTETADGFQVAAK